MTWVQTGIIVLAVFLLGLFTRQYLPSYMSQKGENLATKEDIQEITRRTEEVQTEFRESFEHFSTDLQFKYNYNQRQYSELYASLYAIVIQSEYARKFLGISQSQSNSSIIPFDEAPFFEMKPIHRINQKYDLFSEEVLEQKEEMLETPLTKYSKEYLFTFILEKSDLASQKLLKLAVAYRFAHTFYSGSPIVKGHFFASTADDEELLLIKELVCCIVTDYNLLRKQLKLDYDIDELSSGIIRML